jgi:GT2 family glycosyltransferase
MSKLSVIIVNYDTCGLVVDCLRSIYQYSLHIPLEVIVVDNASMDNSAEMIRREFPNVTLLINQVNIGFAAANNQGIRTSTGDYILLLNSDTIIREGSIDQLIYFLANNPEISVVAPKLLNEDESFQRSFFQFPNAAKVFLHILEFDQMVSLIFQSPYFKQLISRFPSLAHYGQSFDQTKARQVPYVIFACIMLRREVFQFVGLLDDTIFFYHEDCEFGYRLYKAGKKIYWVPSSQVVHLGGGSSRSVSMMALQNYYRSLLYVFRKHEPLIHCRILQGAILSGFLIRAFLTIFGFYRILEIPTTYKNTENGSREPFAALLVRVKYYLSIAASTLGPTTEIGAGENLL